MQEKLNRELFNEIIYKLGLSLRENTKPIALAQVFIGRATAVYYNNVIDINFGEIGKTRLGFSIHLDELPKQHSQYLKTCIAVWFMDSGSESMHEPTEAIQA